MPLPDLLHTFHGRDLGYLRMVAGLWGIELDAANVRAALPQLTEAMLNPELANEIVGTLPVAAQDALSALADADGLIPWSQFVRTYGEVRSMGAAKRDRERPDLNPRTPAEMVWYYGLIGQAFLDMPPEPQQYAYIPADLLSLLEIPQHPDGSGFWPPGFARRNRAHPSRQRPDTGSRLHSAGCACAWVCRRIKSPYRGWDIPLTHLQALLFAAGLLDANHLPLPEPVRHFLEAPRPQALQQLASAWLNSPTYNELRLLPGLTFEGDWANDALQTRRRIAGTPQPPAAGTRGGAWQHLSARCASGIRIFSARPAITIPGSSAAPAAISSCAVLPPGTRWMARWCAAMIRGPLHWLGFYDLAAPDEGEVASAFRPSAWAADLMDEPAANWLAGRRWSGHRLQQRAVGRAAQSAAGGPLPVGAFCRLGW